MSGTISQAGWHSIRPWTPPLYLIVREVTSVSATFILSPSLLDDRDLEPALTSLGLITTDDDRYEESSEESDNQDTLQRKKKSVISDALAGGLSVNVNGSNWQRVFIRIDDTVDEAVIIIYGLMPGRQYDIDMALVQDEQNKIRRQVITQDADMERMEPSDAHTDPESQSLDNSNSSDLHLFTPSTTPTGTHPSSPSSTNMPLTIEDRLSQLQNTLSQINAERESLAASLKSARRDSQKADAALRSEIDVLKRASEKHAAAEHRAKQKILSFQEAVKRAQTATRETEELITEVGGILPGMNKKRAEKEEAYNKVKSEADRARSERDLEVEKEKKKLESMKNELAALSNKLEKLNGKKEKLETGIITDLEEQRKEIECEIERAEVDSYATPAADQQKFTADDLIPAVPDPKLDHSHTLPYLPTQRIRHQTIPAGAIGKPSPTPIQRPPPSEAPSVHQPELWTHPVFPLLPQTTHQTHNQRSASLHHQTPPVMTTPQRRKSSASNSPQSQIETKQSSPPTSQSVVTTAASVPTSTLSSRAPAFEPGRLVKTVNVNSTGLGASPMPIQRLNAAGTARGMPIAMSIHAKANPSAPWAGVHGHFDGGRIE